jgi:hypothetical protein
VTSHANKAMPKHLRGKRPNNKRTFLVWGHRCYTVRASGETWKVTNSFPALAANIPSSFTWTVRKDREGLKRYIDALVLDHRSESIYFEKVGMVDDIQFFHVDRPDDQKINVKISRFVDFMALRDDFNVPLWGRVHFVTDGASLVPREFLASLGQLFDPGEQKFFDATKEWRHCNETDLEKMGLKPEDVTSSMYRQRHAPVMAEAGAEQEVPVYADDAGGEPEELGDEASPQASVRETEVERILEANYADMTTLVQPDRGRQYFARRIMTYEGRMLWVGTSFTRSSWKVWQRDTARLLALGLDP